MVDIRRAIAPTLKHNQRSAPLPASYNSAAEAFHAVIVDLLRADTPTVPPVASNQSIGSGKPTRELMNYTFMLSSPRDRLPAAAAVCPEPFSLPLAAARFVWMMSGSDRLESIRHYSAGAAKFSDDGFVVPGSSYGSRLFYARPGLDQIAHVVKALTDDQSSRRAMATVYQPEDVARKSNDIPCTFGLSFMIRGDRLHVTTIMRSNNAWQLLPYNIFEFSLLAEVVAERIGIDFGTYAHHCLSLHLYEKDYQYAEDWLDIVQRSDGFDIPTVEMDPICARHDVQSKVESLLKLEESIRGDYPRYNKSSIGKYRGPIEDLGPTLSDIARLLLIKSAEKAKAVESRAQSRKSQDTVAQVFTEELSTQLQSYVRTAPNELSLSP